MKVCALIWMASDAFTNEEYKEFKDYGEMVQYMKKRYNTWVIEFIGNDEYYVEKIKKIFGECDEYVCLTIYDDYIE